MGSFKIFEVDRVGVSNYSKNSSNSIYNNYNDYKILTFIQILNRFL